MALINSTTSFSTNPDKMIRTGVNADSTMYTVPTGRKFIGYGIISGNNASSTIFMFSNGGAGASIQGASPGSGFSFPLYLNSGESVRGQYAGISGIESDA